jgi:ribonuclease E
MVHENEHGEHDDSPVEVPPARPRRHRAARRPAGPPVVHSEEQDAHSAAEPATLDDAVASLHEETAGAQAGSDQPETDDLLEPAQDAPQPAEEGTADQAEDVAVPVDTASIATEDTPPAPADGAGQPVGEEAGETHASAAPTEEASSPESGEVGAPAPEGGAAPDAARAGAETAAEGPVAEASADVSEPAAQDAAPESGEPPRARRSRRATRGVVTAAFSSVPEAAPAQATRAADRPAPALFQAPDLTAPPLTSATARSSDAAPADEATSAAAPDSAGEAGGQAAVRPARRATRAAGAPVQVVEEEPAEAARTSGTETLAGGDDEDDDQPRRRRRRGGRRRRRSGSGADDVESSPDQDDAEGPLEAASELTDEAAAPSHEESEEGSTEVSETAAEDDESGTGRRRRRRRRRAGVSEEMEDLSADDPPNTVTKVRETRRASDEVVGVRGSTRIEAKKQRRRDGREAGRRRAPILTEAEFLARRESVNRVMCVRQRGDRTQIAVLEDGILVEHYVNRVESSSMVGNVYLGKVQNVLPSMEAAFVDIGRGRNAVLYAGEVNWDAAGMEGQPKRIELALKSGDPVLVQVTKDPIGHKGARLTSQISLPGRFLVYVPEGSMTGISRKLPDTERARLKGILKGVVPDGAGVIVRTAAEGATEEQLTADVQRLTGEWGDIQRKAKSSSPPTLLYGEPDLAIKVVRDIFNEDFTTLLVQGDATAGTLSDYIGRVAPDLLGRVEQWVESEDLYTSHRIDEQLAKALDRKVWLPSGGSLVIDRTEAMTVVDVNTGKFTGQGGNLEETVTRNNLEAAEEIVRQLRLRDIGGIIVIDFIDMVLESNRDLVLRRLVECLGRDRTKHQVAEVTSLGLVQMTRKRIGQGLLEVFSTPCEACGGRGHIVHADPVGTGAVEEPSRGRERGNNRRNQRPAPQVHLGGKQTGKTPPPPKFDEHGHIDHSAEQPAQGTADDVQPISASGAEESLPAASPEPEAPDAADDAGLGAAETVPGPEIDSDQAQVDEDQGADDRTGGVDEQGAAELLLTLVEIPAEGTGPDAGTPPAASSEEAQHGDGDEHQSDVSDHPDEASASQVVV